MNDNLRYISIGEICNTYGGLFIMEFNNKYYWIIDGDSTDFTEIEEWEEISEELYHQLLLHR